MAQSTKDKAANNLLSQLRLLGACYAAASKQIGLGRTAYKGCSNALAKEVSHSLVSASCEDAFVAYLLAAFGDESIMWHIATRWWRGTYPGRNADTTLRFALKETEQGWKQHVDQ